MQLQDRRPLKNKWDGTFFHRRRLGFVTWHLTDFITGSDLNINYSKMYKFMRSWRKKLTPDKWCWDANSRQKKYVTKGFSFQKDHQSSRIVISVSIMVVSCSCLSLSLFAREKATWGSRRGNPPSGGSLPQIILETLELFTIVLLEAKKAVTIDFMSPVDETGLNEGPPVGQITHIIRPHENYRCRRPIFATVLFSDYWEIEMVFRGFCHL